MKLTPFLLAACLAAGTACKGKDKDPGKAPPTAEAPTAAPSPVEKPAPGCAAGELLDGGRCVPGVTPEAVQAVKQQADRVDELARVLDDVAAVSGPIELLDAFRELDAWKQVVAMVPELAKVEGVIDVLDQGVKQLGAFRASLDDVEARLGNVQGELEAVLAASGAPKQLAEVREVVSGHVAAAVATFEASVTKVFERAIAPGLETLKDVNDVVSGACAVGKLKGGGDELTRLCGDASNVFARAHTYLDGVRTRPAALLQDAVTSLDAQLAAVLDQATRAAMAEAQARVDALLKAPATK